MVYRVAAYDRGEGDYALAYVKPMTVEEDSPLAVRGVQVCPPVFLGPPPSRSHNLFSCPAGVGR